MKARFWSVLTVVTVVSLISASSIGTPGVLASEVDPSAHIADGAVRHPAAWADVVGRYEMAAPGGAADSMPARDLFGHGLLDALEQPAEVVSHRAHGPTGAGAGSDTGQVSNSMALPLTMGDQASGRIVGWSWDSKNSTIVSAAYYTPTLKTVGPEGSGLPGIVFTDTLDDPFTTTLIIANGAVTRTTTLAYAPAQSGTLATCRLGHQVFNLGAYWDGVPMPNFEFTGKVGIKLQYSDSDVIGFSEDDLTLDYWDTASGTWQDAAETCSPDGNYLRNPGYNQLTVAVCRLSQYPGSMAGFIAAPTSGPSPLTVVFTNTSIGDFTDSLWGFGDGTGSTLVDPTHPYTAPGVYTVTLQVSGPGGTHTVTRTNYITVYVPVVADFVGAPTSGTRPLTVVFTNTSTGSYSNSLWDFGNGVTSTVNSPTHTYMAAGVYTVTLTVSGLGGTDTMTRTNYITVNYIPVVADFVGTPTSGERPLTAVFTNNSTGDYTNSLWSFGDGGTSTTTHPTYTYTATGVYTVTLTVSGPGGTDSMTSTNYITVTPASVHANFSATPTSGVAPLVVGFTNLSTGDFTTSSWTFGDGGTSTAGSPTYTYTTAGVYTVTLTVSGLGGTDTTTRTSYITVYEPVVAGFVGAPTVGIAPLGVVFTNTSTGDYTNSLWVFGDGWTSSATHPVHTYTMGGVYTVALEVNGLGGTDRITHTNYITVYTPVHADFTASPTSGVAPLVVDFTNLSTGDFTTSSWTFGDGGTSTAGSPTYTYTTAGVYTVTLTVSGLGGTDTMTRTSYISVYEPVVAGFVGAPTVGISPLTVVFTNTSTGDFDTSQWDFGDGGTSALTNPAHVYSPGVYTVTLTVSGLGGSDTAIQTSYITVYEPVHASFSGTPTSGVAPLVVDFTNLSTGDFTTSSWTFGDGGTSTASSPTYTYTTAGVYTVTLTVSGLGGADTMTRTSYITVYQPVVAGFVGAPTTGMNPLMVVFTNTSTGDFDTSQWDFGDGGSSAADSPTYMYTTVGVYTVTLTVSGPGGTDTMIRLSYITVTPAPVSADFIGTPTSGERLLTVAFTNLSTGDYTSSSWDFGDGGTSGTQHPTYDYTTAGVYTVTLSVSGLGGTDALTYTNYITVTPASVVADFTAAPTSAGMPPLAVVFTNTSTGDFDSSLWDFGDGVTSTVFISPTHTYTAAGVYTVTLQVSGPGGTDVFTRANYINVGDGTVSTPIDPTMGGTLVFTSPSGSSIMIIVPTGAVTQPTTLIYTPVSTTSVPPGYLFGGLAFTLVASQNGTILTDFSFLRPVAVTIHYTDSDVAGLDESTLALFYWDTVTSSWQDVATTCSPASTYWRYPGHNRVVVAICHLSLFGFFGIIGDSPTYDRSVYLPLILRNE